MHLTYPSRKRQDGDGVTGPFLLPASLEPANDPIQPFRPERVILFERDFVGFSVADGANSSSLAL